MTVWPDMVSLDRTRRCAADGWRWSFSVVARPPGWAARRSRGSWSGRPPPSSASRLADPADPGCPPARVV